jgi:hypothetical protein
MRYMIGNDTNRTRIAFAKWARSPVCFGAPLREGYEPVPCGNNVFGTLGRRALVRHRFAAYR